MIKIKEAVKGYFSSLTIRGYINWIILIILIVTVVRSCNKEAQYQRVISDMIKNNPKVQDEITPAIKQAEEIKREVDTAGREQVVYRMSEPIIKLMEDKRRLDSIAAVANVRADKIKSVDMINASLKAENLELKKVIKEGLADTVWEYRDKWLVNTIYKNDTSLLADVWLDASLNKVEYNKKKYWLFGRNENLATIWFNSPYIKPEGFNYYRVAEKEPFVDVELKIGSQYIQSQKEIHVGPKIDLKIGRIGVSGGYYFNKGGGTFIYGLDYKVY